MGHQSANNGDDLLFDDLGLLANTVGDGIIDTMTNKVPSIAADSVRVRSQDTREIATEDDIVTVRSMVKRIAVLLNFSLVNQTKVVTAASEIARNTLDYGGGGKVTLQVVESESLRGLKLIFEDMGPGIDDIERALEDGFTTANGMGLGLGGSSRLMDEFAIVSQRGEGTRVTMAKWL